MILLINGELLESERVKLNRCMDFFCFLVWYVFFFCLSLVNLEVSGMTDKERDQIDTDAETYMRTCSLAINSLKGEGMESIQL